jgi:hypothetical protein
VYFFAPRISPALDYMRSKRSTNPFEIFPLRLTLGPSGSFGSQGARDKDGSDFHKEVPIYMKKLFTLLATLAVAVSLAMPVYANGQEKGKEAAAPAAGSHHAKAHRMHAKKKGATKGKKEGQEGTAPAEAQPKH